MAHNLLLEGSSIIVKILCVNSSSFEQEIPSSAMF